MLRYEAQGPLECERFQHRAVEQTLKGPQSPFPPKVTTILTERGDIRGCFVTWRGCLACPRAEYVQRPVKAARAAQAEEHQTRITPPPNKIIFGAPRSGVAGATKGSPSHGISERRSCESCCPCVRRHESPHRHQTKDSALTLDVRIRIQSSAQLEVNGDSTLHTDGALWAPSCGGVPGSRRSPIS